MRHTQGETKATLQPDDVIIISHLQSEKNVQLPIIHHAHASLSSDDERIMQMN